MRTLGFPRNLGGTVASISKAPVGGRLTNLQALGRCVPCPTGAKQVNAEVVPRSEGNLSERDERQWS